MSTTEPEAPGASPPEDPSARRFTADDTVWIARLAGEGLGGTGVLGTARFAMVHFFREGEPAPRFGALLPAGRFADLYDSELVELLTAAKPLPPPEVSRS